ncbi:MAG: hypothetical protein A2428_14785 [Bdellovibrionales bacterium RIFOXYC1_FULL_54_43]|nr:MAG: hypothetical protein A2428_14785 [Bdellovibrionales bacterium RIFOXYC1_FULL_54_43]OFZ83552.1 MAG: hypothetical protein A2603_14945 [Bdellovibrionales bacterium RIFOXYD1_FULL_55_31]
MFEEIRFRIFGTIAIVIGGINLVAAGMRFNGSDNHKNPAWGWLQPYLQLQDLVLRLLYYAAVIAATAGAVWFVVWFVGVIRGEIESRRDATRRKAYEVQRDAEREIEIAREAMCRVREAEERRQAERERERAEAAQREAWIKAEEAAKSDPELVRKRAIEQITRGF